MDSREDENVVEIPMENIISKCYDQVHAPAGADKLRHQSPERVVRTAKRN